MALEPLNNIFKQKSHFPFVFPRLFAPSCEKKNRRRLEYQTFNYLLPKIKKAATGFYFFCDSHKRRLFIYATCEGNICNQERPIGSQVLQLLPALLFLTGVPR
jgi:hypothetical protein